MAFTLNLGLILPGSATLPYIVGSAVNGGATLSGAEDASDATGGGFWAIDYTDFQLGNTNPNKMLYFNKVSLALAGGVRNCIVPFYNDFLAPVPSAAVKNPATLAAALAALSGTMVNNQSAGDSTVTVTVTNGRALLSGEIFGVIGTNLLDRAHVVTDVDSQTTSGATSTAVVGIRPPLREDVAAGTAISWDRPTCLMRLKTDARIVAQKYWWATPSLSFVEAMVP